jgi:tRNA G46 methylase TrmB
MSEPWVPPVPLISPSAGRVRGALHGSLLLEQPRHRDALDALRGFVAGEGPVALEIGVDHGTVLIEHARERTDWRWIGLEIRKTRVAAARPHLPENAFLWAVDARTLLSTDALEARLDRIDILFPTPVTNPRHLLLTAPFAERLARALKPGGVLTVASDVEGMITWADALFAGWATAEEPWRGAVRSRRERVCRRDAIPVHWRHWTPPFSR